jgi:hypothetical protein
MLYAFKLYTGADNASHVAEGTVAENDRTDVVAIHFKETPPQGRPTRAALTLTPRHATTQRCRRSYDRRCGSKECRVVHHSKIGALGKNFLTFVQHWSGAVMCPACLCGGEAAGHNALRGSGPNR